LIARVVAKADRCRSAMSDKLNGMIVQPIASARSMSRSRAPGATKAGASPARSGAKAVTRSAPAPSSSQVMARGSPWVASRLLSAPKSAASAAEIAPNTMPSRYSAVTPPTTRATPGTTARPSKSSRGSKGRRLTIGSITARNTGASAMQVAPTEAFDALIAA
jgi:hypothetical protein